MVVTQRLISTRRGTFALAGLAAVLALVLVLVYVSHYRSSVRAQSAPVAVLVARTTIAAGTSGTVVASKGLYSLVTVRQSALQAGAFSDPSSLVDHAASQTIYAGEQITSEDFSANATSLTSQLTGTQRVISVPLDAAHSVSGQLHLGDYVDVYAGFNIVPVSANGVLSTGVARPALRLIMQGIEVVAVSSSSGGIGSTGGGTNVSLKVNDVQAAELAFASDNGKIWLALRPSSGAKASTPDLETVETLLLGVPPIVVERSLGGR